MTRSQAINNDQFAPEVAFSELYERYALKLDYSPLSPAAARLQWRPYPEPETDRVRSRGAAGTTNTADGFRFARGLIASLGLENYLKVRNDDIELAISDILVAAARIEHERNNNATSRNRSQLRRRQLRDLMKPVLAIILTFALVHLIGGKLQEASFNRTKVFEAKLQRFQSAESEATEIGFDLQDIYYRIEWDKAVDKKASQYDGYVREIRRRLDKLGNKLRAFPEPSRESLNTALLKCIDNIDSYLRDGERLDLQQILTLREEISNALVAFLDHPGS